MSKGIVISIASPKGGAGKTTITAATATGMKAFMNSNVCCLDIDEVQHTLFNSRQREINTINANESLKIKFSKLNYNPYPIYKSSFENAPKVIDELREKYDFIFVDIPGTLAKDNYSKIFFRLHFMIIPLYPDDYNFESTLNLISLADTMMKEKLGNLRGSAVVFNKYNKRYNKEDDNIFMTAEKMIKNTYSIPVLKNKIYERKSLENGRSTIFALPHKHTDDASFYLFITEMLTFIKQNN